MKTYQVRVYGSGVACETRVEANRLRRVLRHLSEWSNVGEVEAFTIRDFARVRPGMPAEVIAREFLAHKKPGGK